MNDLYLAHYGVKGQRWGVRRYQNSDGSLTELGKSRNRAVKTAKTKKDVDDIVSTFNKKERKYFGLKDGEEYLSLDQGEYVVKRILLKDKNTPVAFFDLLDDGKNLNVAIGTRSGSDYREKGYATKVAKAGINWYNNNKESIGNKPIIWAPMKDNIPSINLAKKLGFYETDSSNKKWKRYAYNLEWLSDIYD